MSVIARQNVAVGQEEVLVEVKYRLERLECLAELLGLDGFDKTLFFFSVHLLQFNTLTEINSLLLGQREDCVLLIYNAACVLALDQDIVERRRDLKCLIPFRDAL